MHVTVATLLALQCSLCLSIRVPVVWNNDNSEVNKFAVETIPPQNAAASQKPIPNEYFQYTAQKPKFAVDIAQFHGVQSPESHYKAYPIKPHTAVPKPELGKHQLLDKENKNFLPYQEYVKNNEALRHVTPSTTSYEIFHPYKLEEPALKELYQDPVMDKIRNDLLNSKNRLQKYEKEAGEPDITKAEYLESPEETDRKKVPQKNVPATYEIHRPQRRPIYYRRPAPHNHRENLLNQKLRHPWHQNYVKIKPIHYRPVKHDLHRLRQQHALKYDDEKNEYPQVLPPEKYSEPSDGYDIFEKGKEKFVQLKNNVDESINEAVQRNRPVVRQKLELTNDQPNDHTTENDTEDEEDDFVPIKNYAQVRKTETTKHLPKEAAYHDADTLEEIQNAPRLREAVKSTKAQTVYSEEGYEDSAYDHAGEQKHASDHEAHGGFLKAKENSGGKFKIPTFSAKFEDGEGSEFQDKVLDGKKWKNNNKDTEEETESEDYSEVDKEHSDESDTYSHEINNNNIKEGDKIIDRSSNEDNDRIKREKTESISETDKATKKSEDSEHDVNKRETDIEVPEIDIDRTLLNKKEISNLSKLKVNPKKDNIGEKYPYYFKKLKAINPNSPLRYAEDLKLIPKKSEGGTEFYDSRSKYECPEVDDDIDPIPEKLKKDGHPDDSEEDTEDGEKDKAKKDKSDFSALEKTPRLRGLGDKIDCFKAKYFGENPLDSPFFKEEIIPNPEPVIVPSIDIYKLKQKKEQSAPESTLNEALDLSKELQEKGKIDMFTLLDKLYPKQVIEISAIKKDASNILPVQKETKSAFGSVLQTQVDSRDMENITNKAVQQNDYVKKPTISRKKRAAPFVYEPYKIIRDSQIQDSKKTTTTNNISPLIKQLQSSRVATNQGKEQVVKRNVNARTYKDIGKSDREKNIAKEKGSKPVSDTSFVDVSVDQRRGEPRYELRPVNHKSQYTPVENKKSISKEDYKAHTKSDINSDDYDLVERQTRRENDNHRQRVTTTRPFFDVTKFLPSTEEILSRDRLNGKNKEKTSKVPQPRSDKSVEDSESEEDDKEYDEDSDDERRKVTTTNSPSRKRISTKPITSKLKKEDDDDELPKLRLITRFHDDYETEKPKTSPVRTETSTTKVYDTDADDEIHEPKYREKKKKSRKSTLVTDTKSYGVNDDNGDDDDGDDEDDLRKKEVDALIGVRHDDKEYMPKYEKDSLRKVGPTNSRPKIVDKSYKERDHYHEDDDEDDDDDDDDDEDDDDDDDDEDDDDEEEENEEPEKKVEAKPELTTPEPTKRTLIRTTEAPPATTESQSARLEVKPVVVKKKFESHKELPVNRSSPHVTEFKQDIKEVEIIKEIPVKTKKKPQKNLEALELYKDENLAKDVNKLGGVEIFKEGLDLSNGPKHGGNYRRAEDLPDDSAAWPSSRRNNKKSPASDAMASQSTSKLVEVRGDPYSRRRSDIERARKSRGRSAKLIELSDSTESPPARPMHGGNFKSIHEVRRGGRRGGSRNAKIVELDEHKSRNDQSSNTHGSNSRSYGSRGGGRHQMHGGNYRSAKIIQAESKDKEPAIAEDTTKKDSSTDDKSNAAVILNTFASAVPVLETTPAYILDPSKRMYYYVDA